MSEATRARAWAVTRRDGLTLGFTDHDASLRFDEIEFRPDSGLSARAVVQGAGLSVDNSEALGLLSDHAITEEDLAAGRWDGADVRLWDLDWANPADRKLLFRGELGEITRHGGAFRAELRGLSEPLNLPQGRVYHPRCAADLGDAACGMDMTRPGYQAEARVISVSNGTEFRLSGLQGHDQGWFERGRFEVLDGVAAGLSTMVKNDLALPGGQRSIELWTAPGLLPQPGDSIRMIAGCDKRGETCRLKFANYLNFRGFPHLPSEDWLMAPQVARAGR